MASRVLGNISIVLEPVFKVRDRFRLPLSVITVTGWCHKCTDMMK